MSRPEAWEQIRNVVLSQSRVFSNQRRVQYADHNPRGKLVMTKIHVPAARVRQGTLVLYATALKVRDLISENFYSVETLDPENPNDRGYQRLLNIARAKRLADYILSGQDSQDAFLPTSVFLATDKSIEFN